MGEDAYAKDISDQGLISKIYKEFTQLNIKKLVKIEKFEQTLLKKKRHTDICK